MTTAQRPRSRETRVNFILIIVTLAGVTYLGLRDMPRKPREVARTTGSPAQFKRGEGGWTWVENPDGPEARLVRLIDGATRTVATAETILAYDAEGDRTA